MNIVNVRVNEIFFFQNIFIIINYLLIHHNKKKINQKNIKLAQKSIFIEKFVIKKNNIFF